MFDVIASSRQYVAAGKLRALAITTATRSDVAIFAVGDVVAGNDATAWVEFARLRAVPMTSLRCSTRRANLGLGDPGMKARLAELGAIAMPGSPADFAAFAQGHRKVGRCYQIFWRQAGLSYMSTVRTSEGIYINASRLWAIIAAILLCSAAQAQDGCQGGHGRN